MDYDDKGKAGEEMDIEKIQNVSKNIIDNVSKVIIGRQEIVEFILAGILAGGHILIEDKPGTGKTMLAKSLSKSISGEFKRVQFTPDLMPSDITGLNIYNKKTSDFELVKGPVFTNIFLADEINRATPRTQSSLLEAMEEKQVSIDGQTLMLNKPFICIATENPMETIGTYPLPEAQLDRFIIKIDMGETTKKDELEIIDRYVLDNPIDNIEPVCTTQDIVCLQEEIKKIMVSDVVRQYIVDVVFETRQSNKLLVGASTRATLALLKMSQAYAAIKGKKYVEPDHVKSVAPYVLGHRVKVVNAMNSGSSKKIVEEIIGACPVPVEDWEK